VFGQIPAPQDLQGTAGLAKLVGIGGKVSRQLLVASGVFGIGLGKQPGQLGFGELLELFVVQIVLPEGAHVAVDRITGYTQSLCCSPVTEAFVLIE
jgi:hypothetical protein